MKNTKTQKLTTAQINYLKKQFGKFSTPPATQKEINALKVIRLKMDETNREEYYAEKFANSTIVR